MAKVKKKYSHAKAGKIAIISSPYTNNKRVLVGEDWKLSDWNKIVRFWSKHPTYSIHVE